VSIQPPISETERAVLKVLWDLGQGTVREVQAALETQEYDWAYTTVQTLLGRLLAKGYVGSDRSGAAHVYRPIVSRGELLQQQLSDLADTYCEGTSSPLMLALVEGAQFTPAEIAQFRELLDKLAADNERTKKGGRK
jgi:predicted transcriptional regulator